jgi:hypothetical protein
MKMLEVGFGGDDILVVQKYEKELPVELTDITPGTLPSNICNGTDKEKSLGAGELIEKN